MNYIKRSVILAILILGCSSTHYAYFSRFLDVPKDSQEYQLLLSPDSFSLREGGLIASGVSGDNMQPYLLQMDSLVSEIKKTISPTDPFKRSSAIFDYMHKKVLKSYKKSATTLDVALKIGEYNCLSSTLLYNILVEAGGIKAETQVMPEHTFSLLFISTNVIAVENTTPLGFDVANNPEAQKSIKKLTGMTYTDAMQSGERVGKKGLLAYVYANRAFFASKAKLPYLAFQNALKAYAIYPEGKNIYSNVIDGYSGYAYYLVNTEKNYKKAMDVLEEAVSELKIRDDIAENYKLAVDTYLNDLVEKGKYDEAFAAFKHAQDILGSSLADVQENLFRRLIYRLVNQDKDFEAAYKYTEIAYSKMSFSKNIQDLMLNGLNELYKQLLIKWEKYPEGEELFLKWYDLLKNNRDFRSILESYYSRLSLKYYEQGDLKKSLELIDKGISYLPASEILRNNGSSLTGKEAIEYMKKKDYNYGIYYFKLALKYMPYDEGMQNNLKIAYREWAYSYIEQAKYKTALQIINQGLIDVPNDPKLMEYQRYCEKKI